MKKFFIILFVLVLSLPFLVSFLYSLSVLCEMAGCELCGTIAHHIEKWINSFMIIGILEIGLVLIIYCFKPFFQKHFIKKYTFFHTINSLLIDPIKRLYAKGILEPQIYS